MTLEEMRARAGEIAETLAKLENVENFSDEDINTVNTLNSEFSNLKTQIETKEVIANISAASTVSTRKTAPVAAPVAVVEAKNGGFKSAGEFFMAVKNAGLGNKDARFNNTAFEKYAEDGGFLVPENFSTNIEKKLSGDESLLARTRQFSVAGNALTLPTDETSPWNGGVQAYWVAEGNAIAESKGKLGQASWRLNKIAALVKATDELLDDAVAMESYINLMAPEAIVHKINSAIISGDGAGKPTGVLNSDFKVTVSKEAAQAADTVVAANIVKMYSRMLPMSRANAVWFINPAVEEQLRLMVDANGNYIYLAPGSQLNQTPYGMLMGRPVVPMLGSMPALGDLGDILFADLSYYYTIIKSGGVKNSVSTHLYFDRDITAFKFTMRLDGKCPFKAPVVTEFGNYEMSAFVVLEAR